MAIENNIKDHPLFRQDRRCRGGGGGGGSSGENSLLVGEMNLPRISLLYIIYFICSVARIY